MRFSVSDGDETVCLWGEAHGNLLGAPAPEVRWRAAAAAAAVVVGGGGGGLAVTWL